MHVGTPLVAECESSEAMQPRQRAFDHPAEDAEPTAVRTPRFGDDRDDALLRQARVSWGGPVGPIALDDAGLPPRAAASARHGRQRGDQRFELRHIVHIRRGEVRDQRNAARVGDDVVFRALLTAIGWVRSSFFPPRNARTEALSITVHR